VRFYYDGIGPPTRGYLVRLSRSEAQAAVGGQVSVTGSARIVPRYSDMAHEALAPVADRVEVFAATPHWLIVSASVAPQPGWEPSAVVESVRAQVTLYLQSIAFGGSAPPVGGLPDEQADDVRYGLMQATILQAPGVWYLSGPLFINDTQTDVVVPLGAIASLQELQLTVGTEQVMA
jgi:hypothetical protein